jgi:thiol-disulfide isomerase/thioredoxin
VTPELQSLAERAALAAMGLAAIGLVPPVLRLWLGRRRGRILATAVAEAPTGIARILFFTGSWCSDCHSRQKPALDRLSRELDVPVEIEELDAVANPELTRRYGVSILPTTVVLDPSGRLSEINYGYADEHTLRAQLHALRANAAA